MNAPVARSPSPAPRTIWKSGVAAAISRARSTSVEILSPGIDDQYVMSAGLREPAVRGPGKSVIVGRSSQLAQRDGRKDAVGVGPGRGLARNGFGVLHAYGSTAPA